MQEAERPERQQPTPTAEPHHPTPYLTHYLSTTSKASKLPAFLVPPSPLLPPPQSTSQEGRGGRGDRSIEGAHPFPLSIHARPAVQPVGVGRIDQGTNPQQALDGMGPRLVTRRAVGRPLS